MVQQAGSDRDCSVLDLVGGDKENRHVREREG